MGLQTVYSFTLPVGYQDKTGALHREGEMRLATAGDELSAMRDPAVKADPNYMATRVLSRVVTRLGSLEEITPEVIEGMFVADLEFLQNMYETINAAETPRIQVTCPHCGRQFTDTINFQGAG